VINYKGLPLFKGTMNCLERGWFTKAHRSNEEYTRSAVEWAENISETERLVAFDPQTSGGLLLSVSPACAKGIVERISTVFPGTAVIGTVMEKQDVHVIME
jgi:selenide,water dikinase